MKVIFCVIRISETFHIFPLSDVGTGGAGPQLLEKFLGEFEQILGKIWINLVKFV